MIQNNFRNHATLQTLNISQNKLRDFNDERDEI